MCIGEECASKSEMKKYFKGKTVNIIYKDSYTDKEDKIHPVKSFIDNSVYLKPDINETHSVEFFIQDGKFNNASNLGFDEEKLKIFKVGKVT